MDAEKFNADDYNAVEHIRKPFVVKVVRVTRSNIASLAPFIGELKEKDGSPYIQSKKHLAGNTYKVYPGFYVTQVGDNNPRCYSKRSFKLLYHDLTPEVQQWVNWLNGVEEPQEEFSLLDETAAEVVEEVAHEEGVEVIEVETIAQAVEAAEGLEDVVVVETCEHGTPVNSDCPYKGCSEANMIREEVASSLPEPQLGACPVSEDGECEHGADPGFCMDPICDNFPGTTVDMPPLGDSGDAGLDG